MQFAQRLQTILSAFPVSSKASFDKYWENMGIYWNVGKYGERTPLSDLNLAQNWLWGVWCPPLVGSKLEIHICIVKSIQRLLFANSILNKTYPFTIIVLDDNCTFKMFLWLPPISTCMYIHEGLNISCLGSSCIKDTMNRNVENVVHFHLLLMSFTLFFLPRHNPIFRWFLSISSLRPGQAWPNTLLCVGPIFAAV